MAPLIVEGAAIRVTDPHYTRKANTPRERLIESIILADEHIIPGE
jgi:hypothetical protein